MGTVSTADLRGVLRFLDTAEAGSSADPLPRSTLVALGQLIPSDFVEYFELRRQDRAELGYSSDRDLDAAPGTDETTLVFGHQNPLRWRNFGPADGALRLSDITGRRDLHRLDFYHGYLKPNRIRDTLKIWLSSTSYSAACVSLNRSDADFSRRDADVIGVLQHHLAAMRGAALREQPATEEDRQVNLTPREAQVLSWVVRGRRNDEIGRLLFMSPATVHKHLEHAYEKLNVHSRAEAVARLLLARRLH